MDRCLITLVYLAIGRDGLGWSSLFIGRLCNALVAEGREKQMWYALSSTEERLLSIDCVVDRLVMQKNKMDLKEVEDSRKRE